MDFGFADIDVAGERIKAALFGMTLPYSDAVFIQSFPRECTETFQEGHRALEFFGAVSYDNSRVAIGVDQEGFRQVLGVAERILRFKGMYNDLAW